MFAKTLYKPTRPDWVDDFLGQYTRKKVPYFFQEAKGKDRDQVSPITESLVNQLRGLILNKRISYHNLAPFDYKLLMHDPSVEECDPQLALTYDRLAKKYHFKLAHNYDEEDDNLNYILSLCKKELDGFGFDEGLLVDQLVYYLFNKRSKKSLLWCCFGDKMVANLKQNVDRSLRWCRKCGRRFKPNSNRQLCCPECAEAIKREKTKLRVRKLRAKNKNM